MRLARTVVVRAGVRILVSSASTITSQSFTTPIRVIVGARAALALRTPAVGVVDMSGLGAAAAAVEAESACVWM